MSAEITIITDTSGIIPSWLWMWFLAVVVFAVFKYLSLRTVGFPAGGRLIGYLLAWPGMNAAAFLNGGTARPVKEEDWLMAAFKTQLGLVLLWGVARLVSDYPLVAGWIGMIGMILTLHFGSFHLIALGWQKAGVDAAPIMNQPVLARSLSDFWFRWNAAFHRISHDFIFRPLSRRFGIAIATLGAFLFSGLVHDLIISVPAQGGYGLPTLYFLLQGCGVLLERKLSFRKERYRRAFALLFVLVPVYWLFHPMFVLGVIVPFLDAISAL